MREQPWKNKVIVLTSLLLSTLLLIGTIVLQMHSRQIKIKIEADEQFRKLNQITNNTKENITETQTQIESNTTESMHFKEENDAENKVQKNPNRHKKTQNERNVKSNLENLSPSKTSATEKVEQHLETTKAEKTSSELTSTTVPITRPIVLSVNLKTKRIHGPNCPKLQESNPEQVKEILRDELDNYLLQGYKICSTCKGYAV